MLSLLCHVVVQFPFVSAVYLKVGGEVSRSHVVLNLTYQSADFQTF